VHKIRRTRIALGALAGGAKPAAAALLTFALALTLTPGAHAGLVQSGGHWPRSDRAAAKMVHRSPREPRADNHSANHTIPTRAQLRTLSGSRDGYPPRLPQNRTYAGRIRLLGTTGYDPRCRPVCDLESSP
jgi:hypothetical protein